MKCIVAGTTNPAKIAAIRQLVGPMAEVIAAPVSGQPVVEESGGTIAEIAREKARAWSSWLAASGVKLPVIVTDGGLTVPGLGGQWEPTRTRRFAGEGATPLQLALALLDRASGLVGDERRIGWIEAAAVIRPAGQATIYSAESPPGMLATTVRAEDLTESHGFWIPAIWLCPEFGMKRLIDLTDGERSRRLDHWDRLGAALRQDIESFLEG